MSMSSTLTDGDLVAQRYRLQRVLGAGATAVVWAAHDIELGRPVALKLLAEKGVDDELRRRFEREAELLGRVRHPNLVEVLASGHHEGRPFLVMELLEGRSLAAHLDSSPLPPSEAAEVALGIADGLGAVHRAGVVHRDVKPGNIVLEDDGRPRLVDFGIARSATLTDLTRTDVVMGTAAYLSPEQAQAQPLDARSDVYALGCVLHEMIAGSPPFDGPSGVVVAYRHIKDEPPALRSLVPGVPPALEAVVLRCLAKRPDDRYADGAAVAADLRRLLAGEEPAAVADQRATTVLDAGSVAAVGVDQGDGVKAGGDPTTVIRPANPTEVMDPVDAGSRPDGSAVAPAAAGAPAGVAPRARASSAPARSVDSASTPPPQRRPRAAPFDRRRRWVAAGAAALLLFLLLLPLVTGGGSTAAAVPDVAGLPYDDAVAALEAEGLRPARIDQQTGDAAPGTVIGSRPAAGAELDEGATVELLVAVAPPPPPPPPEPEEREEREDSKGNDDKDDDDGERGGGNGSKGKDD